MEAVTALLRWLKATLICPAARPGGGVIHIREAAPGQPTGCQRARLLELGELAVHRLHPLTDDAFAEYY